MFEKLSNLRNLRSALHDHIESSEYFLRINAFFDGELIFGRDVTQLNLEMTRFPIDFEAAWKWFSDSLSGASEQETFAYELPRNVGNEDDPDVERLLILSKNSSMTVWVIDLAIQEAIEEGRRFVVITIPSKRDIMAFRKNYHGKDARELIALDTD